jgi:hypothetical protein
VAQLPGNAKKPRRADSSTLPAEPRVSAPRTAHNHPRRSFALTERAAAGSSISIIGGGRSGREVAAVESSPFVMHEDHDGLRTAAPA